MAGREAAERASRAWSRQRRGRAGPSPASRSGARGSHRRDWKVAIARIRHLARSRGCRIRMSCRGIPQGDLGRTACCPEARRLRARAGRNARRIPIAQGVERGWRKRRLRLGDGAQPDRHRRRAKMNARSTRLVEPASPLPCQHMQTVPLSAGAAETHEQHDIVESAAQHGIDGLVRGGFRRRESNYWYKSLINQ